MTYKNLYPNSYAEYVKMVIEYGSFLKFFMSNGPGDWQNFNEFLIEWFYKNIDWMMNNDVIESIESKYENGSCISIKMESIRFKIMLHEIQNPKYFKLLKRALIIRCVDL